MSVLSPASDDGRRTATAKSPIDPNRACKVCGDKANGYNFGVLTCESCKAFFRRNAAKEEEIKCPFSDACGITAASRRYCQACRLKKCFAVGMNKDWLTDVKTKPTSSSGQTKRKLKREPTGDNEDGSSEDEISVSKAYLNELIRKAKRPPTSCECECTCGFYPRGTRLVAAPPISDPRPSPSTSSMGVPSPLTRPAPSPVHLPPTPYNNCIQMPTTSWRDVSAPPLLLPNQFPLSAYGFQSLPASVISAFSPLNSPPMSCEPPMVSQSPSVHPSMNVDPQMKMLLELSRSSQMEKYAILSPDEGRLLQELVGAAAPLNNPLDLPFADGSQLSIMEVVRITETALRRIVCMATELTAFNQLQLHDKTELMKGCCSEILILCGVKAYDPKRNTWNHSFSQGIKGMEVKLEVLKGASNESQHYEEHKRFLESFDERVRNTDTVMLVLMAILIFNGERPKLSNGVGIRQIQNRYDALLRRILECEFGPLEAAPMYDRLKSNLRALRHLNHGLIRIFYGFDTSQLDPLIKELFDMK